MLALGRDYRRSVRETRTLEASGTTPALMGDTLLGWPEYQLGRVAIVFATLFAAPRWRADSALAAAAYESHAEARALYLDQARHYHRVSNEQSDYFCMLRSPQQIRTHLLGWTGGSADLPVGLVVLMEGGDGIASPSELPEWFELGVRIIGPAWAGTRFCGGTNEPGPLTAEGRELLREMALLGFTLDLSHMDEQAAFQALDMYEGPIIASHVNASVLLPGYRSNRHLSDACFRRLIERSGVVGNIPMNSFLMPGWSAKGGNTREEVTLSRFVDHIDHICQLAGNSLHSAIGSDFDGGFGLQSVPAEIDSVADIQKVVPLLQERGYGDQDVANILGLNWARYLESSLPV